MSKEQEKHLVHIPTCSLCLYRQCLWAPGRPSERVTFLSWSSSALDLLVLTVRMFCRRYNSIETGSADWLCQQASPPHDHPQWLQDPERALCLGTAAPLYSANCS